MRVGLLTRFFGVLGIIAGVLTVFQLDQPGIVRAFWLIGVGLLIARPRCASRPRGRPAAPSRGRPSSRSASSATRQAGGRATNAPPTTEDQRTRPSRRTRARSASAAADARATASQLAHRG